MKRWQPTAVILSVVVIALISFVLLARRPADGFTRYHDFLDKNKCFSVDIDATSSSIRTPGKGSYLVRMPDSYRLTMDWGDFNYNYVKDGEGSVEFENAGNTYQQYASLPKLGYEESVLSDYQMDSLPVPLLRGDLKFLAPVPFKPAGSQGSVDTYKAEWSDPQNKGKVVVSIGADGRLLSVDFSESAGIMSIHRVMRFSNYVINPPIQRDTFSTVPPLGYSSYKLPYEYDSVKIGEKLRLGVWKSGHDTASIDPDVAGKLLIVRVPDSPPADALISYVAKHPLPVKPVILSLGESGGQYNSPSAAVARQLNLLGSPLMILLGSDSSIKALWLGFDPDNPLDLAKAISEALKGRGMSRAP